jgi:hypothetical protein
MDASLSVFARLAHIRTAHLTRRALTATTPHRKNGEISDFHARDGRTQLHYLTEHLVADDEFLLTIWRVRASSGNFCPVGAANTHSYDPDLDLVLSGNFGLRPIDDLLAGSSWDDRNCFHGYISPR